jgi:hypothetical protein
VSVHEDYQDQVDRMHAIEDAFEAELRFATPEDVTRRVALMAADERLHGPMDAACARGDHPARRLRWDMWGQKCTACGQGILNDQGA